MKKTILILVALALVVPTAAMAATEFSLRGFIEAAGDPRGGTAPPNAAESADTGAFRLRHAMFRLNWPETQLLIGQYWSFLSEFSPEVAQDSGFQFRGAFSRRLAQLSIVQNFAGAWSVGFMVGTPRGGTPLEPT